MEWDIPIILIFGSQMQKDQEVKASLGYLRQNKGGGQWDGFNIKATVLTTCMPSLDPQGRKREPGPTNYLWSFMHNLIVHCGICMHWHRCKGQKTACMKEWVLTFYHVGLGDWAQAARIGDSTFTGLSYLGWPSIFFFLKNIWKDWKRKSKT